MIPGLTVPVVRPESGPCTGVSSATSTIGIIRLNGAGRPTSRTKDCRYCRLYWTVNPQWKTCGFSSLSTVTWPPESSSPESSTLMVLL